MITQILWLLKKTIDSRLVTSFVLSLSLTVTTTAVAKYNPPPDQRPPGGYTTSSGSRGVCGVSGGTPLTVLAPQRHVGQTTSTHPTFAWFVPDSKPLPMEFILYKYSPGSAPKVVHKIELRSSPGIMNLTLPEDKPDLTVGQRYLWQVAILCNSNHPSSDLVARAEIEVVQVPPALKRAIATKNRLEMANLYAEAGLWYDALREALEPAKDARLGEVASSLLEDLAELEEPKATQIESRQSANLRQIASSQR